MSKKVIQNTAADGSVSYAATDATIGDVFTTAIKTNEAVLGLHGLSQRALLVVGGMVSQSMLAGQGPKFWAAWKRG